MSIFNCCQSVASAEWKCSSFKKNTLIAVTAITAIALAAIGIALLVTQTYPIVGYFLTAASLLSIPLLTYFQSFACTSQAEKNLSSLPSENEFRKKEAEIYTKGHQAFTEDLVESNLFHLKAFYSDFENWNKDAKDFFNRHLRSDFLSKFCFHKQNGSHEAISLLRYWAHHQIQPNPELKKIDLVFVMQVNLRFTPFTADDDYLGLYPLMEEEKEGFQNILFILENGKSSELWTKLFNGTKAIHTGLYSDEKFSGKMHFFCLDPSFLDLPPVDVKLKNVLQDPKQWVTVGSEEMDKKIIQFADSTFIDKYSNGLSEERRERFNRLQNQN